MGGTYERTFDGIVNRVDYVGPGFDAAMAGDPAYEASPLPGEGHTHVNEYGRAVRCYHACRSAVLSWQLWLGFTLSFPFEHALWEKVPPFNLIAQRLGLL